jgi:glycosyltransferase involved in cell wall biosynthesis
VPYANQRVLAILPALNEAETVGTVVAEVRSAIGCDVLVVDDGSRDATGEVAKSMGASVLRHPFNLGVGAAIGTGLAYAREHGYDVVIQVDSDGQHDPSSASALLDPVLDGHADLAVGSRFANGYEVSGTRAVGMRFLSWIVSRRVSVKITDTTSGFRAFGPNAIRVFSEDYPTEYLSDTVEALLDAHDAGLRIVERPVVMRSRMGGTASSGRVRSGYLFLRLLLVILFHPLRPRRESADGL